MEPGHEVESPAPATDDSTPLPMRVEAIGDAGTAARPSALQSAQHAPDPEPFSPTPGAVLVAIAAANGPWFPSQFAAEAGVSRDHLDDPLAELRVAGLVRVAEWVRGIGQGYELTADGKSTAADPAALERLKRPAIAIGPAALLPPPPATEEADDLSPRTPRRDPELAFNPPIVVPALLLANTLWFFVCAVYSIRWGLTPSRALWSGHHEVLHRFGAVSGGDLLAGEWWRLLSSCFVHIGALHLIGNMFALAMMGPLAELLWGRWRLLLIYFVSGLAGSALAMTLRPDAILAGASGAIWGIQMSLFAWLFAFRHRLPVDLANDWFRRLCVVFVLNAGVSFLPNVSWEGHLGGGAAGFLVAGLLNAARFGDRTRRLSAWLLLALVPVICVGALASAMDAKGLPGWQRLRQRLDRERDTRAVVDRLHRFQDADAAYRTHVLPRIFELAPDAVRKPEFEAGELALRSSRPAARVEAAKKKIRALKATAEAILEHAPADPVGVEPFDQQCARDRALAAARVQSFDLLLALLDAPGVAPAAKWAAWERARREADELWIDGRRK